MFKTRLQEICQKKRWNLPTYSVEKKGLDHLPVFHATVSINGLTFSSGELCKSAKEAQNEAAMSAFNQFSDASVSSESSSVSVNSACASSTITNDIKEFHPNVTLQMASHETNQVPQVIGATRVVKDNERLKASSTIPIDVKEFCPTGTLQKLSHETNQAPQVIGAARVVKANERVKVTETQREVAEANIYKSKLHELCQRNQWRLPDYAVVKKGPDHLPQFQATVSVNGLQFATHDKHKSSKEAQNNAAKCAFDQFCTQDSPPVFPFLSNSPLSGNDLTTATKNKIEGLSTTSSLNNGGHLTETLQLKPQMRNQIAQINSNAELVKDESAFLGDACHSYKSQLQNYTQKRNISLPAYSCQHEGSSSSSRFKGIVRVGEKTYESQLFRTVKEAEHAAARTALMSLSQNGVQEDESGYKNLLQELAQKECYHLPLYKTSKFGEPHAPNFVSTVEVDDELFTGLQSKTKKLAEMSAARVAYMVLKQSMARGSSNGHRAKGNIEISSSSSQASCSTDLQQSVGEELPMIPKDKTEKESERGCDRGKILQEVEARNDPRPIATPVSCGTAAKRKEASSSMSNYSDLDMNNRVNISSSSCTRVIVFPQAHPRDVPPGGTWKILSNGFIAHKYEAELSA